MKLLAPIVVLLAASAAAQWEKVNVPTSAGFRGLSVVSESIVWASGTDGTVIRTVDDGKHWSVITVPGAEKLDFRGIRAFDDKTAIIISSGPAEKGQARIYRTKDGGATWKQVFEEKRPGIFFDAVAFWDRKHGIVLSDPIDGKFALFVTNNGGSTWKQIPPSALPPALPNEGAFAASNSCLTVDNDDHVWFATGGASVARVFRSTNRGRSWKAAETPLHPINPSSGLFSLAFEGARFGVVVGGDYTNPSNSELPNAFVTADGGKTWQIAKPNHDPGFYLSSVTVPPHPPDNRRWDVFAAGTTGLFTTSLTGDRPWIRDSQESLNAVVATDHGTWAVGAKGVVLHLSEILYRKESF